MIFIKFFKQLFFRILFIIFTIIAIVPSIIVVAITGNYNVLAFKEGSWLYKIGNWLGTNSGYPT
jgi:hypothetical protein